MALGKYNLLDLAQRSGDNVYAIVEGVITCAPELSVVPCFARNGITYTALTRNALPSGDFFKVGGGQPTQKSEWSRALGSMALFGGQMRVSNSVAIAQLAENSDLTMPDILADEALAYMRGSAIKIGSQFYYGQKVSADGFAGLVNIVNGANIINSGGAGNADSSSAWLVYLDDTPSNPQGTHFLLGNSGKMQFRESWLLQQTEVTAASGNTPATYEDSWCNGFASFMGLNCTRPDTAMVQLKNINAANPLTDAKIAQMIAQVPQALMADRTKWRLFCNVQTRLGLQLSRTALGYQTADPRGAGAFSGGPTHSNDIELICTDSLVTTERNGTKP